MNARQNAYHLSRRRLDQLGLGSWQLELDASRSLWGLCVYPTGNTPGRIVVSWFLHRPLPWCEFEQTLLHEAAHALCPQPAASEDPHGPLWRAKCLEIGCSPEDVRRSAGNLPHVPWKAICSNCQKCLGRWQRPKRGLVYLCPCGSPAPLSFQKTRP